MLKYLCLLVAICCIYAAPVDEVKDVVQEMDVMQEKAAVHPSQVHSNPLHVSSHSEHEKPDHDVDHEKKIKPSKVVEILESGSEKQSDGSYSFHYRGADGTFREETAVVKNQGTEKEYLEINGAYSFIDADGKEVVVHYKADDKGFVPVGNNILESISLSAKENSQLPPQNKDGDDDDDVEE